MMEHQLRGREMAQQGSELAASLREQPQVIHLATRKNLLCIKLGVVLQMVSIAPLARGNSVPGPLVLGMMSPRTELCGGKCPHCPPPPPPPPSPLPPVPPPMVCLWSGGMLPRRKELSRRRGKYYDKRGAGGAIRKSYAKYKIIRTAYIRFTRCNSNAHAVA